MSKLEHRLPIYTLLLGIVIGWFLKPSCGETIIKSNTFDTIYITIDKEVEKVVIPEPKIITKTEVKEIYKIDTLVLVNDLYNAYVDSVSLDSMIKLGYNILVDGKILDMKFGYSGKHKVITNTIIKEKVPNEFFILAGLETGGNVNLFNNISPIGGVEYKKNIYLYKYNLIQNTHNVALIRKFSL
jgi:hypothetical protein